MIVPLYNAELSLPEIWGSLVVLQQLAITFGILVHSPFFNLANYD
jgi:Sugar (and other) transporter